MKTKNKMAFKSMPRDYAGLIRLYPLRPIHDRVDLNNATEITDAMAGHVLTEDQEDYFDVLATLIDQYERVNVPQPRRGRDPVGNLAFLLEQHGMSASDLGRVLGQRELGSKVLGGKRALSKANIVKLAEYFRVSPACFI